MIAHLGGRVSHIVVNDLQGGVYYAKIIVDRGGKSLEIDSRPSDAIAVAVTFHPPLPIYVAEHVLDEATSNSI